MTKWRRTSQLVLGVVFTTLYRDDQQFSEKKEKMSKSDLPSLSATTLEQPPPYNDQFFRHDGRSIHS